MTGLTCLAVYSFVIGVRSLKSRSSTSDASLHSCLPSKRQTSIVSRKAARVSTWLILKLNVILSKASKAYKKTYRVRFLNTHEGGLPSMFQGWKCSLEKLNESSKKGDKSGFDLSFIRHCNDALLNQSHNNIKSYSSLKDIKTMSPNSLL